MPRRHRDRVAGIFMQTWLDGEVNEAKAKSAMGDGNISQSLKKHVQASKALPIKPGRDNNT